MHRWFLGLCLWLLLPSVTWAAIGDAASQAQLLAHRVGFGRNATGGAGGSLCTVNTLADSGGSGQVGSLRHCMMLSGPQWIVFSVSGTITLTTAILPNVGTGDNKTIDGRGQTITIINATTNGFPALFPSGVNNWIVHNISIRSSNNGSSFLTRLLCVKNHWWDHIDTSGANTQTSFGMGLKGGSCPTGAPNLDTDYTGDITISYSKFHDRCYVPVGAPQVSLCGSGHLLFGQGNALSGEDLEPGMAQGNLTLHHNWYQQTGDARFPNFAYGKLHAFNNYMDNHDQAAIISESAQLNSENDIFDCSQGYGGGGPIAVNPLQCGFTAGFSGGNTNRYWCSGVPSAVTQAANCKVTNAWRVVGNEPYQEVNAGTTYNPASFYNYTAATGCTSAYSCMTTADATLRSKITDPTTGAGAVSNPYNYQALASGDAMVGWWKFNESSGTSAAESSGSGVGAGTLVNMESPGDWVQGLISPVVGKGALELDGVDEYVTIPDHDVLSPVTTGEFSICAWVRPPSAPTDFGVIAAKGTSGQYEYAFDLDNANPPHVLFVLWPASGSPTHASVTSSTTVPIGAWTHVCGTYAFGISTDVYLNAVNRGTSAAFTGVMTNGTSPVNIGRRPDNLTYLKARVDDVRMFNYALTQPEIALIMAEGFDVVYHLDEVASPSADSGQPGIYGGTWVNTPTPVIPGKLNNALGFASASSEYVTVPTSPSLSGPVSVALWVKMTSLSALASTILSNSDATPSNTQIGINTDVSGLWNYLYTTGGTTRGFNSATGLITTGAWIHLAVTDDGAGTVQLYQGGVPISSTPFGTPTAKPPTAPGPLTLGRQGARNDQYTNGAVDEVHLVSRIMSAGEIAALAAEGSTGTAPPAAPTNLRVVSP